jgi:hypothetical protein
MDELRITIPLVDSDQLNFFNSKLLLFDYCCLITVVVVVVTTPPSPHLKLFYFSVHVKAPEQTNGGGEGVFQGSPLREVEIQVACSFDTELIV